MRPRSVIRERNFARLFFAGAASIGGFSIGQVAINYLVFTSTRSAIDLALTGVAFTLAMVSFSVFGGTLADRRDRRAIMILCDGVRAASLALVAIALLLLGFNLWLILVVSFVLGAFSAVFQPAERAMVPSLLEKERLAEANGLIQLTSSLAQTISNAAGGALVVAVGAILAIGFNSVTFLVSGLLIATISVRKLSARGSDAVLPDQGTVRIGFLDDAREGVRYLVSNRGLLWLTVSAGSFNFFGAMVQPFLVIYTTELLHGGAATYGVFLALYSLGAAPGSLLVGRVGAVRKAGLVWLWLGVVAGFLILLLAAFPAVIVAFTVIFFFGFLIGFSTTTWLSIVQIIVPNEMQGRYFGIDQLGSFAVLPVGQIVGGLSIAALGLPWTYTIAAAGAILTSLIAFGSRELRNLGYTKPVQGAQ